VEEKYKELRQCVRRKVFVWGIWKDFSEEEIFRLKSKACVEGGVGCGGAEKGA
jgi:hypothetical protein